MSAGAAIAVPFAIAARSYETPFHYVESATRLDGVFSARFVGPPGQRWFGYVPHRGNGGPEAQRDG